jgi:predicted HicB family RNase H-like nuclease
MEKSMTKREKRINSWRNNPKNVRPEELYSVLEYYGFERRDNGGVSMDKRNFYDYGFQVRKLSKEDGGGYIATINEFDGVMAAGDTVDEALDLLSEVIHDVVITANEIGRKLPKPRIYEEVDYSGKFLLRIPKSLHKRLSNKAAEEGISLNQYVTSLISYNFGFEESKIISNL